MPLEIAYFIYATAFRLAVIAVGAVAILLGYLLFVRGAVARGRTEAGLEISQFKLDLKTAAPGTGFAAFGAAVVVVMLVTGSPSLMLETAQSAATSDGPVRVLRLKGGGGIELPGSLADTLAGAAERHRAGNPAAAMAAYSAVLETPDLSVAEAALALEPMARIALARGDHEQAETLGRMAVLFSGAAPAALDTLARTLIARERPAEAVPAARRAAQALPNEPRYLHTLARGLAGSGAREEAAQVMDQAANLDAVYAAERTRLLGEDR